MLYSLGIIHIQLVQRRSYTRENVAWITAICVTSYKSTALIASCLYRFYGCRVPVILGGIITCAAYVLTALSSQGILTVYVLIGVLSGVGHNFIYVPTWIAANTYYKEKRQLANGLVMSGSAIGGVVFHHLLNDY